MKAIIGRKIGMTSIIHEDGSLLPITLIKSDTNTVTQLKTLEKDGYSAMQLGEGQTIKQKRPQAGHTKATKVKPRVSREFRLDESELPALGDTFDVSTFEVGDKVQVTGVSKGKGFAGTIKRWNFHTGPKTHGSRNYRRPGSIGSMYPQKIFKGKKMAGRMGHDNVTVKNLKVALVDTDKQLVGIKGAVPGPKRGTVYIRGIN